MKKRYAEKVRRDALARKKSRDEARELNDKIASGEVVPFQSRRLDKFLADENPDISRAIFQKLIANNRVEINGKHQIDPTYRVKETDDVQFFMPHALTFIDEIKDFENNVIFENHKVIVINKPAGILTHSKGALNDEFTVADFAKSKIMANQSAHYDEKIDDESTSNNEEPNVDEIFAKTKSNRPGIVHRLDRATSGVLILAKNSVAAHLLQKQFQDRKAHKTYLAIVDRAPKIDHAKIDLPIGRNPKLPSTFRVDASGKSALTEYNTLAHFMDGGGLVELRPTTGRTHQLRVHLSYIDAPIAGDPIYNEKFAKKYASLTESDHLKSRLFLHAAQLEITIPDDNGINVRRTFVAPLPDDFKAEIHRRDPAFDLAKLSGELTI